MRRKQPTRNPGGHYSWLLIPVLVFIAYVPALDGQVLWDDLGHITVPELRSWHGLWRIWFEIGATQQYYPLLHSAFWIEHRLWGDAMVGYHLVNVALHSCAAVILVRTLRQLAVPGALLAGLIFALHPVCVESVAWISEQKNTLSAVFYLAAAFTYLRFAGGESRDASALRTPRYWLAFFLFVCALLTKSVTATLPAALLVIVWWKRGRLKLTDVPPLVPWFVLSIAGGLLTLWFERESIGARGAGFDLSLIERILVAGRVIWFYLATLIWPHNLVFIYPRWTVDASVWRQYLFPLAALVTGIGLAVNARRRPDSAGARAPLAGYLFFVGTLVPVLGFVNVYPFLFSYVADHFQYLASLGVIVPAASGLTIAAARLAPHRPGVLRVAGATLVLILGALTWNRSMVYHDSETLFRDTVDRNPGAWMAFLNLGTELANRGRLVEAIEAYEGALRARPDYPEARRNLVLAHMKLGDAASESSGRASEAIAHYGAALKLDASHFRAHYNLGTLLMDVPERTADAIAHLEAAQRLQPDNVEARVNLGIALSEIPSRRREAMSHLQFARMKRPDLAFIDDLLARLRASN